MYRHQTTRCRSSPASHVRHLVAWRGKPITRAIASVGRIVSASPRSRRDACPAIVRQSPGRPAAIDPVVQARTVIRAPPAEVRRAKDDLPVNTSPRNGGKATSTRPQVHGGPYSETATSPGGAPSRRGKGHDSRTRKWSDVGPTVKLKRTESNEKTQRSSTIPPALGVRGPSSRRVVG